MPVRAKRDGFLRLFPRSLTVDRRFPGSLLNIDFLCANSPQSKGRVERAHQTLQDRLVNELRLRGISMPDEANRFVLQFIAGYSIRFAKAPSSAHDAHRPLRGHESLEEAFCWKKSRKLSRNLTIHFNRNIGHASKLAQAG